MQTTAQLTDVAHQTQAGLAVRDDFTWFDDERVIRFGPNALDTASALLAEHGFGGYALLTTERAIAVAPSLAAGAGVVVHVPHGAVPDAAAAVHDRVRGRPLVALGGGRVVDSAKAIAAADGLGGCAAIPTTLSGAEMTRGHRMPAGVPEPAPLRLPYWRWCQRPTLVISDPRLMASQPMPELAASALNALAHAAEALWTSFANPVADGAALHAAALIKHSFCAGDGPDRPRLALGALLAGYAVGSAHIAFHHALCQTMARTTGLPHAQLNAVMLPHSVEAMVDRAPEAVGRLAVALGADEPDPAAAVALVAHLAALVGPTTLAQVGVEHGQLGELALLASRRAELANNPQPLDRDDLRAMLERVYGAA